MVVLSCPPHPDRSSGAADCPKSATRSGMASRRPTSVLLCGWIPPLAQRQAGTSPMSWVTTYPTIALVAVVPSPMPRARAATIDDSAAATFAWAIRIPG
jgi:hypothetical protein